MWVNIPVNKCSSGGTMASKIKVLSGRSSNGSLSQLKNSLEDNFFPVFWRWVSAAALYLAAHSFIDPIVLSSEDEILDKSLKSFLAKLQNGHGQVLDPSPRPTQTLMHLMSMAWTKLILWMSANSKRSFKLCADSVTCSTRPKINNFSTPPSENPFCKSPSWYENLPFFVLGVLLLPFETRFKQSLTDPPPPSNPNLLTNSAWH